MREGHPLLTLVDTELRLPSTSLAIRGEGLWADHVCETSLEHWTVANEAFSVALDDPDEALGAQRGVLVPLGIDLEWESAADPVEGPNGYSIEATVSGEILIADESLGIDLIGRLAARVGTPDLAGAARPDAARPPGPAAHRPARWRPVARRTSDERRRLA